MTWRERRKIKKKVKKMNVNELAERRFYLRQKSSKPEWRVEQLKDIGIITDEEKFELGLVEKESERKKGFHDATMLVGYGYGMADLNPKTGRLDLVDSKGVFFTDKQPELPEFKPPWEK